MILYTIKFREQWKETEKERMVRQRNTSVFSRMKDCTMQTVNKVQEEAGDILADAKAINESRAAEAAQEVIEDTAAEEQTAE